ncbi:hypothetical protein ACOSP7_014424 [Xanthoceras sorbifolium]
MGGRNSDTAGAASTSQRAVTDSLINKNEMKIGVAAPPDSYSVVGQINESTMSSFTGKGVVFMSPKQIIMEECLVQNVQQVKRTNSIGRSETDFYSVDTLQSASEKLTDKGSAVNSRYEDSTTVVNLIDDTVEISSPRKKRWKRIAREKSACRHIGDFEDGLGKRAADDPIEEEGANLHVQNGSNSWQSRFHFEEAWLHDEEAKKIIENNWHHLQGSSAVASVAGSVGRVTSRLHIWNRDKRKKATLELKKLRGDLKELMGASS